MYELDIWSCEIYPKILIKLLLFSWLQEASEIYSMTELRILSNWGHLEYTCVYRFRVHGDPSFVWEEEDLKWFFSFGLLYAKKQMYSSNALDS